METKDPQFLYMVMVLPSLFGFTLIGEGMYKLAHAKMSGIISMIMGMGFVGAVVAAYMVLSGML